jgi:hypothetical protein
VNGGVWTTTDKDGIILGLLAAEFEARGAGRRDGGADRPRRVAQCSFL